MNTQERLRADLLREIRATAEAMDKSPARVAKLAGGNGQFYQRILNGGGVRLDKYDIFISRLRNLRDEHAAKQVSAA